MTREALKVGLQDDTIGSMKANYLKDKLTIEENHLQSKKAWLGGMYLQAGQLSGVVNTYIFQA